MTDTDMKTVLAGVDGSEHSADALALALELAPVLGAAPLAAWVHPYADWETARHEGRSDGLVDEIHLQMRELGVPVDKRIMTLVPERSPATGLRETAGRRDAVLITLGASRRSRLGRVLLGGTAEQLLSGSPCPVAIAPPGYAQGHRSVETIGVAFDGSAESINALAWAKALALSGGLRLRLVTVHEPLASAMPAFHGLPMVAENTAVEEWLGRRLTAAVDDARHEGLDVDGVLLQGRPAQLLERQSRELDLMVTGSRGYGPARSVLLGSVSGALVRHADGPVAVVPRGVDSMTSPAREEASWLVPS
jgi:nucleotide-binding universal stress UspA family protein